MKHLYSILIVSLLAFCGCFALVSAQDVVDDAEYVKAVAWMYTQKMTSYADPVGFRPYDLVTRQEAAKFFVGYTTNVLLQTIDPSRYCSFDDLDSADQTLKNDILQACMLRLFKGNQGLFHPERLLSKAEALTVLLRTQESASLDESGTPWWRDVYDRATQQGLTKEADVYALEKPLTRYELALLIHRADKIKDELQDIEQDLSLSGGDVVD